jgi:hypothetical protein
MDFRTTVGGTGTLVGLSGTVYLQLHPTWATGHPYLVLALYGATLCFLVLTLFQLKTVQRILGVQPITKKSPPEEGPDVSVKGGIEVGGDVSGASLDASSGNYYGTDAIKAKLDHERLMASPPSITKARLVPILDIGLTQGELDISDKIVSFVEADSVAGRMGVGKVCDLVIVHNKQAPPGQEAARADAISTRITFSPVGRSDTTFVDRACWVGNFQNEIYLQPGDTAHVLLRVKGEGNEWLTYSNPNQYATEWPSSGGDLRPIKFGIHPRMKVNGVISIIEHKNQTSITLSTRRFLITVGEVGMFVNIRMEDETSI